MSNRPVDPLPQQARTRAAADQIASSQTVAERQEAALRRQRDAAARRNSQQSTAMVLLFDFTTFFLGLAMTTLGEFFALAGGANNNLGLAIFSILLIILGIGVSTIRELTSENQAEEQGVRKVYGLVCFISGVVYIILPIVRAALLLIGNQMDLGSAILLSTTVIVGIVYIFLGYSWAGAFESPYDPPS